MVEITSQYLGKPCFASKLEVLFWVSQRYISCHLCSSESRLPFCQWCLYIWATLSAVLPDKSRHASRLNPARNTHHHVAHNRPNITDYPSQMQMPRYTFVVSRCFHSQTVPFSHFPAESSAKLIYACDLVFNTMMAASFLSEGPCTWINWCFCNV